MARLRNAPSTQQPAAKAPTSRQALKEKTNTTRAKASAPVYEDDGRTEDFVKNAKPRRGRPRKALQSEDEFVMAGAQGESEDTEAQKSKALMTTDELAKSDAPPTTDELAKSDAPPPTAKANRRPARTVRKVVQNDAQNKVLEGLKQRMAATACGQKTKPSTAPATSDMAGASSDPAGTKAPAPTNSNSAVGERSEFSLSPSPPPPGKLSAAKGKRSSKVQPGSILRAPPGSVFKVQSTPAVEISMMALKNFKRRPRQPSMLQMVQQRTASARPSMANDATAVENAIEDSSIFDLDLSEDGEDDFAPEAEGTPLNAGKSKRRSIKSDHSSASATTKNSQPKALNPAKKRNSDEMNNSVASVSTRNAKRRKPAAGDEIEDDALLAPTNRQQVTNSSSQRAETPHPLATSDVQVINSPSTSTPPTAPSSSNARPASKDGEFVVPSTEREDRDEQPVVHDDVEEEDDNVPNGTMAEPISSPASNGLSGTQQTDYMAYPATQVSPPPVKKQPKKKQKPVSTAILQSLLPKRRQPLKPRQRKNEFDQESDSDEDAPLDASHLDDDEDELGGGLRRQTKAAPAKSRKTTAANGGRLSEAITATARKSSMAPSRKSSKAPTKKVPKTYGRATTSDKENEDSYGSFEEADESTLPEVSLSMQDAFRTKELEDAKRKFAEVDGWDMEFESMSAEDHRSSSQGWR